MKKVTIRQTPLANTLTDGRSRSYTLTKRNLEVIEECHEAGVCPIYYYREQYGMILTLEVKTTPDYSVCPNCGGELYGDGYTAVTVCENLSDDINTSFMAPDEGPVYCSIK